MHEQRESDHVELALEASCGALRALEQSRAEMAAAALDLDDADAATERAIVLLRRAIRELRLRGGRPAAGGVTPGFVIPGSAQSSPLRSA
jgi:hypothetical protein